MYHHDQWLFWHSAATLTAFAIIFVFFNSTNNVALHQPGAEVYTTLSSSAFCLLIPLKFLFHSFIWFCNIGCRVLNSLKRDWVEGLNVAE
jgi:hypothetical protein